MVGILRVEEGGWNTEGGGRVVGILRVEGGWLEY